MKNTRSGLGTPWLDDSCSGTPLTACRPVAVAYDCVTQRCKVEAGSEMGRRGATSRSENSTATPRHATSQQAPGEGCHTVT